MGIWYAHRTLEAIHNALASDGGNRFRQLQGKVLPHIDDAYRADEDSYRTHLGASVLGNKCERAVFYGHRWAHKRPPRGKKGEPPHVAHSRMIRLWNRGHLEEGRFIAMLLTIGVQVIQQDENGRQYRMKALAGHMAGSGDGFLIGIPDLPMGVPCLSEFKTHGLKSFKDLVDYGVQEAKPEHYVQMQQYMHHFGLLYALYVGVCKDSYELHAEIVMYDRANADTFLDRAARIIYAKPDTIPDRMRGASPAYHVCKYMCDFTPVCYSTVDVDRNCRTCTHIRFREDGTVRCGLREIFNNPDPAYSTLDKGQQLAGCDHYRVNGAMAR